MKGKPRNLAAAYSRESVVAEKFQAMVMLGIANSRMKDFYDVWGLSRRFEFQGPLLCQAIRLTFGRRRTPVPVKTPMAVSPGFSQDHAKQTQWRAFVGKGRLDTGGMGLDAVVEALHGFLMPLAKAIADNGFFEMVWPPRGPWQSL